MVLSITVSNNANRSEFVKGPRTASAKKLENSMHKTLVPIILSTVNHSRGLFSLKLRLDIVIIFELCDKYKLFQRLFIALQCMKIVWVKMTLKNYVTIARQVFVVSFALRMCNNAFEEMKISFCNFNFLFTFQIYSLLFEESL